ncbi:MAG: hypothetical protein ACRERC_02700 [Candidatus Binatia bacterium]
MRAACGWMSAVLLLALAAAVAAAPPAAGPVTDATVATRVAEARNKADHQALATYYRAKAAAEEPRILECERVYGAYLKLEGKEWVGLQRQARSLLKGTRLMRKSYLGLADAHQRIAWEE